MNHWLTTNSQHVFYLNIFQNFNNSPNIMHSKHINLTQFHLDVMYQYTTHNYMSTFQKQLSIGGRTHRTVHFQN